MYLTGGHGSRHRDEAFGDPYELPPDRAYAETCASIAALQWCWRMLLATGNARYAEEMERALLNAIAASTAHNGTAFFYSNPLQLRTGHDGSGEDAPSERLPWYDCACCPPNLARLYASLQGYAATSDPTGLQLHLIASGTFAAEDLTAVVETGYPWDGDVMVTVRGRGELAIRVPAWATDATADVTAGTVLAGPVRGEYLRVSCDDGATVRLTLPMTPRLVRADARVDAVRGCVAIERGPLVYCVEQADLPEGILVEQLRLEPSATTSKSRARTASGFASLPSSAHSTRTSTSPTALPRRQALPSSSPPSRTRPGPIAAPVPCGSGSRSPENLRSRSNEQKVKSPCELRDSSRQLTLSRWSLRDAVAVAATRSRQRPTNRPVRRRCGCATVRRVSSTCSPSSTTRPMTAR